MKRGLIIFLILQFSFLTSPAQNVREVFKSMPDSLTPYLSMNNRLDMMDFMDAGMKAVVTNQLGGDTEMTFLSDDSLSVKMNETLLLDLKLQKQDTATVVILKRTYLIQQGIQKANTRWSLRPLPHIGILCQNLSSNLHCQGAMTS